MITEREAYIESWLGEERAAHIHGWDFSHIQGRYDEEQDLPWSYEDTVRRFLAPESLLLDIDTGGGEFLLSLGHPHGRTAATEFYPPNVQLCRETLTPLGIDFREADSRGVLPFPDRSFDLVINRHGDYRPEEIRRILKPGGVFVTEQVGAENDRALVELLLPETPPLPFPEQYLDLAAGKLRRLGFSILEEREAFRVVGFSMKGPMSLENCFERVPEFWGQTAREIPRLAALMDGSGPMGILGVSACDGGSFSGYYIAAATRAPAPADMAEYSVPAGTWAVFPCRGPMPQAMQDLQRRIVSEWLPSSGYEYAEAPDIEVYSADNLHNEVWLPIVPKK